jgi:MFS family permease
MHRILDTYRQSFAPLKSANFRIYLGGQAISLIGTWLQVMAQGWVVWELSHSAAALGVVGMLSTLPILILGPWAGVWADRLDRRKLLIGTQVAAMALAFILAILTQTKVVQLWHVYILSALLGVVTSLDMPAQQAFIGDLSGMAEVRKAVVLNAMIINVSRTLGPALGGFIVGALGSATAFWLNGLSFIAVIISLVLVRSSQVRKTGHASPLGEFWEGLQFIGRQPRLTDLIIFVIIITFLGFPVINIFPSLASEILHGDAKIYGLLAASSGLGALTSTIFLAPIFQAQKRVGLMITGVVFWMSFWFMLLSRSTWVPLSLLSSFATSLGAPLVITTATGLLQQLSPGNMRARLLSTFVMLSFGMQPFASLLIGFSAEKLGTPTAILINGVLMALMVAVLFVARPALRTWEVGSQGHISQKPAEKQVEPVMPLEL